MCPMIPAAHAAFGCNRASVRVGCPARRLVSWYAPTMTRSRLARRSPLPRQDLSPQSIFAPTGLDGADPDSSQPRVIVVDDQAMPELLIGRARLAHHLRLFPHRTIAAFRVSPPNEGIRDAIIGLDGWKSLTAYAAGVSALHASGMPLAQIRQSVRGAGHVSDLGRIISVFSENPSLLDIADRSKGALTLGHLLTLARAPVNQRESLAREAIARGFSVHKLASWIARPPVAMDADIEALVLRLGDNLQTDVEVSGTADYGEVRLAWFTPEQLQGLFVKLGQPTARSAPLSSPGGTEVADAQKRWLPIAYRSAIEFEVLFGHLLGSDSGFAQGVRDGFAN